jgi:DNA-binding NarL/FixJ family response regulator
MLRILIADDHPVVRRLIRDLLKGEKGWEVCAEARTGREAVAMAAAAHPDVAVLDLSMPELDGLQAARLIHEEFPQTQIIILTMHEPSEVMDELTGSFVRTCMRKTDLSDLIGAVRDAGQPNPTFSKRSSNKHETVQNSPPDDKEQVPAEMLTELERNIVRMIAQAKNNTEIADALSLTVKGVETHKAAIMRRLQITSVFDLIHYALRQKLVKVRQNLTNPLT